MIRNLFLFILFVISPYIIAAKTINVPADFPSIRNGLLNSDLGDTILIAPGIYEESIELYGRVLGSWFLTTEDTSYISQTIIQGVFEENSTGIYLPDGVEPIYPLTVLSGLTIRHFDIGIICEVSSPDINNCVIRDIGTREAGAGFINSYGNPVLTNVVISNIGAGEGASGSIFYGGNSVLENVLIKNIVGHSNGIGVSCSYNAHVTLNNVTIFQVSDSETDFGHAAQGNGILNQGGNISIQNSIFSQCVYGIKNHETYGGTIEITHSNVFGNFKNNFLGLDESVGLITQTNINGTPIDIFFNISQDPQFVNDDEPIEIENTGVYFSPADLHLQNSSPCIGAGIADNAPEFDLEGNPRDALPDMGAYEYVSPEAVEDAVPREFALLTTYPNPFNAATNISFELPEPGLALLAVYNVSGQKVRELAAAWFEAGPHAAVWDGCDDAGMPLSSGLYFVRLQAGRMIGAGKMVLLR